MTRRHATINLLLLNTVMSDEDKNALLMKVLSKVQDEDLIKLAESFEEVPA